MKEIKSLRKRNEKHFLNSDGSITCYLYNHDIHYKKNNEYIPINNKLIDNKNYIINKENDFKVSFSKDKRKKEILDIVKDNHYLIMSLNKKITKNTEINNNKISYKEALNNIDIDYEIISKTLKESIILKNRNSVPDKISFIIDTDLRLRINNKGIEAKDEDKNIIFMIDVPYMKDSVNNYNYNINYTLIKREENYLLNLNLDKDWLENKDIVYPVVIDPTIICNDNNEVYDTYITDERPNDTGNISEYLNLYVHENGKKSRILLKFNLPNIGTCCDIVKASVYLTTDAVSNINESPVNALTNVHALTKSWTPETATWNNMNNNYNERIEDFTYTMKKDINNTSEELGMTEVDITRLVRSWYAGEPNYGIMIKRANEIYDPFVKSDAFFSKTYDKNHNSKVGPSLIINYRNLNGLEDYMSYKTIEFSEGASYINNLTGNLTTTFNLNETIGGKYPIGLSLVYNTNDVVLNNDLGYGLGWKLNLHETIKETEIDNNNYLEYLDADGTLHYFRYDYDNEGNLDTSKYIDEDGLGLTAVLKNNTYVVTDKDSNEYIFTKNNNVYYLTKLIDTSKNEVVIEYTNNKITKVTDANNSCINITYNTNNTVISSEAKTTTINYNNNKVTNIITKFGTTSFNYNSNNIITKITDSSGISYKYEYYDKPYKIKKVTELGLDNEEGVSINFEYGSRTTRIIDNKNRYNTYTFNEQGNAIGITNLDGESNLNNAYGKGMKYENASVYNPNSNVTKVNKACNSLNSEILPVKYTKNLISNSSFETTFRERTDEYSRTGNYSLKITQSRALILTDLENKTYTYSGYFKNANKINISILDYNSNYLCQEIIPTNDEFTRYNFTFKNPDNNKNIRIIFKVENDDIAYLDDVQLEEGSFANYYNILDNGDFSNGLNGWTILEQDSEGNIRSGNAEVITLENNIKAIKFTSSPDININLSKKIPMHKTTTNSFDKVGDIYNLSFWYKNTGLDKPGKIGQDNSISTLLSFNYTDIPDDMGYGLSPVGLIPNNEEWQFFSNSFVSDSRYNYNSIDLNFFIEENANLLYITNISITKDALNSYTDYDDETGNASSIRDASNNASSFKYDKNNQLTSMFNPMGNNFKFEYDNTVTDRVLKGISPTGISNEIKYDNFGNPVKTIINNVNPDNDIINNKNYSIRLKGTNNYLDCNFINKTLTFKEDNCSNDRFTLIKENDYYRFKIGNLYIAYLNNNIFLNKELNDNTLFKLKLNDNGSYSISPKTKNTHNLSVNNETLTIAEIDYDNFKQQFYFEDIDTPLFIETKAEYTSDGKFITKTIDALEKTTEYDINPVNGLTNSVTDANKIITNYTYNNKEQITKVTKNNKEVKYEYNNNDLLSKITSGNKNYNFSYDNFLNTKDIKINNNTLVINEYEANNGNLLKSTYGNNSSISYTYDELDRIKTLTNDNKTYNYTYDNLGNLAKIEADNEKYEYLYSISNKLSKYQVKTNDNFSISYDYNKNDNISSKIYSLNDNSNLLNYTYNEDDAVTKVTFDDNNLNYTYDYLGRLISKDINNKEKIEYEYLRLGNKTSTVLKSMKINNDLYEYKYDNLYNITDIYLNKELINHYEYDNFNELIKENNYIINKTIKYTYDTEGNILSKKEYELNTENLINTNTYEYSNTNWEDQLTKFNDESITYDNIGNPLTIGSKELTWENVNSLKTYKDLTNNINVTYEYDNENLRLSKSVNNITKYYYWEANNVIYEKLGDNLIYYLRDSNNALIGLKYNDTMYYYIKNIVEDIIGITDSNNNLLCSYEYDSWGKIITIKDNNGNIITDTSHIGLINPYRYRSYYYDEETKLYYLNSRYYNPEWGRFINSDIYVDTKQDINSTNMYSYTGNNPVNRIDVDGELWFQIAGAAIGGAISVTATLLTSKSKGMDLVRESVGSFFGGAYAGLVMTSPIGFTPTGLIASTFGSAFIESEMSGNSIKDTVANTVINGTISVISGKAADKVAKLNKGWIRPTKLKTSFTGKYIKKVATNLAAQTVVSSGIHKAQEICQKGANYIKNNYNKAKKTIKSVLKKLFK